MKNYKVGTMELDVTIPHKPATITICKHAKSGVNIITVKPGDYGRLEMLAFAQLFSDMAMQEVKRAATEQTCKFIQEEAEKEEIEIEQVGEIKWKGEVGLEKEEEKQKEGDKDNTDTERDR